MGRGAAESFEWKEWWDGTCVLVEPAGSSLGGGFLGPGTSLDFERPPPGAPEVVRRGGIVGGGRGRGVGSVRFLQLLSAATGESPHCDSCGSC